MIYQEVNRERREIAGNYTIANNHQVRFAVSDYDRTLSSDNRSSSELRHVSGRLGANGDEAFGIALDAAEMPTSLA